MSNLRLGIFVVAMLAIFGAGIFWIGSQTFLFSSTYHLNADFDNVVGLADGAVVRVGGTHQGAVQHIGAAAGNLQSISAKVNNGSGTVGALINDKTVFQQAAAGATAFREDMEAMKHNFLTSSFFHKRGYENEADLMKYAVAKLPAQSVTRKFTYEGSRVFANPDTAKFKKESILNEAGKFLESAPFGAVVVAGYGDMKGDTEEERTLAAARAMVVREYLVKSFKVDDTRVRTIGFGKTPDVPDGGRIEVLVYPESAVDSTVDAASLSTTIASEGTPWLIR